MHGVCQLQRVADFLIFSDSTKVKLPDCQEFRHRRYCNFLARLPLGKGDRRAPSSGPMNTPASQSATPNGIPAATIIIYRNCPEGGLPQVLMTVRSKGMAFAGGMAVFPGGRVDEADFMLADN
jgi:hypothetical protein